ncbi:hypothetical protein C8F01DRAFT_1163634 [Mycena amicta]|nr:hypothetical protein C8F01DRAFT_1163634 [Mycena amicta]
MLIDAADGISPKGANSDPQRHHDKPPSGPPAPPSPSLPHLSMGRRKIEIQPITHERNRSVTFVKRKLGLMKKAYELGVLCSVDVAVIIFEDRPGHDQKLYTYSSIDIRDIVTRHTEHDGERDTKGPSDFSGVVDKGEDAVGEDDEDADEEEPPPPPPKKKAKANKDDMEYRDSKSSMTIPSPPISIRKLPSTTKKTSIPTSSTRQTRNGVSKSSGSAPPAKKPRLAKSTPPKDESSDEEAIPEPRRPRREPPAQSLSPPPGIGSGLTLPPPSSIYNFPPVPPPSMSRFGGGYGGGGSTGGYFPSIFDLPGPGGSSSLPPSRGQYDPTMFEHLLRSAAAQRASFGAPFGVDWPVHSHPPPSGPPPPPHANMHTSTPGENNYTSSWLDYLSGMPPPPASGGGGQGFSFPSPGFGGGSGQTTNGSARSPSTVSWERERAGRSGSLKRPASASGSVSDSDVAKRGEEKD